MARCDKGAAQAGQSEQGESEGQTEMEGQVEEGSQAEEELVDDVVESAIDDLAGEAFAVFDDDFIRSRRALNALKGRPVVPSLLSKDDFGMGAGDGSAFAGAAGSDDGIDDSGVAGVARAAAALDEDGPEDGLTEEIIGSQTMWCGKFLSVEDVKVRLPNGRVAHRDVVRHPGAVAVIALTNDGKLVLVHQYRTSLEQVTLEIPAGKLNLGEDPAHAAARELAEETGYKAARMAYLGPVAVAAGYSDEIIHMYLAMGLTFVGASPDDDEFLHVDLVDLGEMVDRVLDGKVVDSKTIIGVMLCDAISRRMEA